MAEAHATSLLLTIVAIIFAWDCRRELSLVAQRVGGWLLLAVVAMVLLAVAVVVDVRSKWSDR